MSRPFTDLNEVKKYLQHLYVTYQNSPERIDGNMKGALARNENEQARRTAALFFEYRGRIYGLASDTTFAAVQRFYGKLESGDTNAIFFEKTTEKGTPCLWLGLTKDEPDGWYCYEASYFNNWSDSTSEKLAA
jgi:hypothetical protein